TTESIPEPNSTGSELEAGSSKKISNIAPASGFRPLKDTSPDVQRRYQKLAERSARNPLSAIQLKCIECCGWHYAEAKRCDIKECGLWSLNQRIFHGVGRPKRTSQGRSKTAQNQGG